MPQVAYYPETSVEPMLKSASDMMRSLVGCLDEAQQENSRLETELARVKAASAGRVELEKVATLTNNKVEEFVNLLADHAFLPSQGDREKYAAACRQNPNVALDIAMQAIRLSEGPVSEGASYTKSANGPDTKSKSDMSAWGGFAKYLPH